jgi:hypothetical protein
MDIESLLSPEDIADLHATLADGYKTVQEWQEPSVVTTFVRGTATNVIAADIRFIRIALDQRDMVISAPNQGAEEISRIGTFRIWATDTGVANIRRNDRFLWGDRSCVVLAIAPERFGTLNGTFKMLD